MKIARLASLMLVAILAIGLVAVSVASAAEPEFNPVGATVTGTSGAGVLTAGEEKVTCAKDTSTSGAGKTTATLIGNLTVHFLECTGKNGTTGESCPAKSEGAPSGLILTKTLHGVLGLILPKPATGSGVALLLLPVSGQVFVTIEGTCLSPSTTAVEGKVAGVVEPVSTKSFTGKLLFLAPAGVQAIKEVDLSTGGLVKPSLKAFGIANASEETTEEIKFSAETEVT
jgi:hypothetical protein